MDQIMQDALAKSYPFAFEVDGTVYRFATATAMWEMKDLLNL